MSDQVWPLVVLAGGIVAAVVGAFGTHLLGSFNGRYLENYCRLRGRPQRFGEILDRQDATTFACNYLFLCGLTVSMIFGMWCVVHWLPPSTLQEQFGGEATQDRLPLWTSAIFLVAVTLSAIAVRLWIPQLVVHNRASLTLYHTWPLWRAIDVAAAPLHAIGAFFQWLGHRLSQEVVDEDFEEESFEDEIRTMVTAGEREGLMARGMRDMIQGVMNLDEYPVQNIMTPRSEVDAIDINEPWSRSICDVIESGRTRLPVYDGTLDNVVGVLFVKDLLVLLRDRPPEDGQIDLRPLLREAWQVPGNRPVYELLQDFSHRRSHMAIVVDDFSEMLGVVTIEDALEEIVGEIADELDEEPDEEIFASEDGLVVEALGRVSVEKLNKTLGWDLPESDDYETLAGLVITATGSIPAEDEAVEVGPVSITVLESTDRQVRRLRLEFPDRAP